MLSGRVAGSTRDGMVAEATVDAERYYGTKCVKVELAGEMKTMAGFVTDWTAEIKHRRENRAYGPDRCTNCGKEFWP